TAARLLTTFRWNKIRPIVRVRIDLDEFLAVDAVNAIVSAGHIAPLDAIYLKCLYTSIAARTSSTTATTRPPIPAHLMYQASFDSSNRFLNRSSIECNSSTVMLTRAGPGFSVGS